MTDDPIVLAYTAGLFDGEGTIGIVRAKNGYGQRLYHRVHISLTNTDDRMLNWMQKHFDGWLGKHWKVQPRGCKPSRRWQTSGPGAEAFLHAIRPYLITKAEAADIAFEFWTTRRSRAGMVHGRQGTHGDPVTEEIEAHREALRIRLVALNKRGVDTTEE